MRFDFISIISKPQHTTKTALITASSIHRFLTFVNATADGRFRFPAAGENATKNCFSRNYPTEPYVPRTMWCESPYGWPCTCTQFNWGSNCTGMHGWTSQWRGCDALDNVLLENPVSIHFTYNTYLNIAADLKHPLLMFWCQISQDTFRGLVESISWWGGAILAAHRGPTAY